MNPFTQFAKSILERRAHDKALGDSPIADTMEDYWRDKDVLAAQATAKDLLDTLGYLGDFVADAASSYEGLPFKDLPLQPTKDGEWLANKLVKLDDAIAELYLLDSYIFRKVVLAQISVHFSTLYDVLKDITATAAKIRAAGKLLEKIGLGASLLTLGARYLSVLGALADAVSIQKSIAKKIRFYGRESRLDLSDNILAIGQKSGGHPRITTTVSTRN